jgi:ATP-dependent DNA helicase RecG
VFGGQVAFLAPLEVLAQQHYRSLAKLLLPLGMRVELLTGSLTDKHKQQVEVWLFQQYLQGLMNQ